MIQRAGAGNRLPDGTNPLIVMRDGKPILGSSAIGAGLFIKTLSCLANILDFGMDPKAANDAPELMRLETSSYMGKQTIVRILEGQFDEAVLKAAESMGISFKKLPVAEKVLSAGFWVGVYIDPETGILKGTSPSDDGTSQGN
jgi:gamma-glutamyltranspeptidase/glutathione hydrolase